MLNTCVLGCPEYDVTDNRASSGHTRGPLRTCAQEMKAAPLLQTTFLLLVVYSHSMILAAVFCDGVMAAYKESMTAKVSIVYRGKIALNRQHVST